VGGGSNAYPKYFEGHAPAPHNPLFDAKAAVLMKILEMLK
jgi:hypothetical protein